jgi:predicted nucleotidyltransferase
MSPNITDEVKAEIGTAVAAELNGVRYRLLLFGSRSRGTGSGRSDYDIGIAAGAPVALDRLARIRESLDNLPLLQRIDLVDLGAVSPAFAAAVESEAVLLDEH